MSTSLIFKHLLDILKIESNLDGEGSGAIGKEWLPHLVVGCADLRESAAAADTTTTNKDRLTILPKVLKCYSRLLNKAVSIPLSQIKHTKLVEAMIEGLVNLLAALSQGDKETRLALQKVTVDEEASLLMIFLHLITIYEAIGTPSQPQSATATPTPAEKSNNAAAEDEHISAISLQLYGAILTAVYMITDDIVPAEQPEGVINHKLNHVFSGPLATQAVHSLLSFCGHRAKRVSGLASTALLHTLRCFARHRQVWRTCLPGAFSGLFLLTQSGYKSGSGLLGGALACLLELTAIVTADSLPENTQLLTYLKNSSSGSEGGSVNSSGSGSGGSSCGDSAALFNSLLTKTNGSGVSATTLTTPLLTDTTPAAELGTLQGYMQWRVALLQRIQLPLAVAVREVLKLSGPLQRVKLITQLGTLLCNSSATLGSVCVSECVSVLLSCTLDTTPVVRSTTASVWHSVQCSIKDNVYSTSEYAKVVDALGRKYFDIVSVLYGNIKLSNEVRIRDQLSTVLGVGYGIQEHVVGLVRLYNSGVSGSSDSSSTNSIIRCISTLYMPDPAVCGVRVTASVLETRKYTYHQHSGTTNSISTGTCASTSSAVEGGYYRVAWRHIQDSVCKEYEDRWALFAGRNGLLEDILTAATKCVDKLYYNTSGDRAVYKGSTELVVAGASTTNSTGTTTCTSPRALHTSAVVGALRMLNTAVLGLAAVRANSVSGATAITTVPEVCGHCGKTSTTSNTTSPTTPSKMLRCSRCKAAHYCSPQHQKRDWPTHKLTCKPAAAAPLPSTTTITATANTASGASSGSSGDVNSPTDLLISTNIQVLPLPYNDSCATDTSATHSVYSTMKKEFLVQRSVLLFLNIIQHYLSARNTTTPSGSTNSFGTYTNTLVVVAAIEGLGNIAYSAGAEGFQRYLIKLLFPLLEALVDADAIVKQAALCTLQRIALYVEGTTLQGLVRNNLDYIVDRVCMQLRGSGTGSTSASISTSTSTSTSTHLIVDFVFSTLHTTVQDSSGEGSGVDQGEASAELSAPMHLLRDVICDSLSSIDAYCAHSTYTALQLTALLRVLRVLACRAAAAPTVLGFVGGAGGGWGEGSSGSGGIVLFVSKHLQEKIFAKSATSNTTSATHTTNPITNTDTNTNSAAHCAAVSLIDFTRNLFNLTYTDNNSDNNNTTTADPADELLNAERIRAQIDAQNERDIEEEHSSDAASTAPPTAGVQLLLDVVHRGAVFLTLQHPPSQVIAVETLCAAFVRLSAAANSRHHLLPCIHATWPVLMSRVKELVEVVVSTECANLGNMGDAKFGTADRGAMIGTVSGGARDKSQGGSKVLLGLEGGVSSVSLTTSGGSGGIGGIGLSVSSTTRRTSNTIQTSVHTIPTTSTNTTPSTEQRSLLHVLPHLFDLLTLLTVAGGEYMTIKLKQELLPLLYVLLRTYLQRSVVSSSSGRGGSTGSNHSSGVKAITDGGAVPSKVLSRSQLIITPASNDDASTTTSNTTAANNTSTTTTTTSDRHSVHNKVKLSLLSLLTQLCRSSDSTGTNTQITRLMSTQVAPLVYLVLPLLGARECDEVREAAQGLLTCLYKLDSAVAGALLNSVYYSSGSTTSTTNTTTTTVDAALQSWRAVQHTPSVVTALTANPGDGASVTLDGSVSSSGGGTGGSVRSVVNADRVLSMYHNDRALMSKVHVLLSEGDDSVQGADGSANPVHCVDGVWVQKLSLWSTV